jgi:branched-subunit amino acid transport protein
MFALFYTTLENRDKEAKRLRRLLQPCIAGVFSFIVCYGLAAHVGYMVLKPKKGSKRKFASLFLVSSFLSLVSAVRSRHLSF